MKFLTIQTDITNDILDYDESFHDKICRSLLPKILSSAKKYLPRQRHINRGDVQVSTSIR